MGDGGVAVPTTSPSTPIQLEVLHVARISRWRRAHSNVQMLLPPDMEVNKSTRAAE